MKSSICTSTIALRAEIERWPLAAPFRISSRTYDAFDVVIVSLQQGHHIGQGEAMGVHYRGETTITILRQIDSVRSAIESGRSRDALRGMLPPGGARNALDCALWDLQARCEQRPAWQIAGLAEPRPLLTTFTCGADEPIAMAAQAVAYRQAKAIKLKLTGEPIDAERVVAVRTVRPDVWLGVDANQAFTREFLEQLIPILVDQRVALIEQPFHVGEEQLLDGLNSPIPIAADESVQGIDDLASLASRFDMINIKLDKCGGLTEAFLMAQAADALGLKVMVGNMGGTSLAMAPAFLVGQSGHLADLDGPVLLKSDRADAVDYVDGLITCTNAGWGSGV
jgi:L-Ala-D/L-Glu epimerase